MQDAGKRYGYKPRMIRLQLIHQLLFYLVHAYDMEAASAANSESTNSLPAKAEEDGNVTIVSISYSFGHCKVIVAFDRFGIQDVD